MAAAAARLKGMAAAVRVGFPEVGPAEPAVAQAAATREAPGPAAVERAARAWAAVEKAARGAEEASP